MGERGMRVRRAESKAHLAAAADLRAAQSPHPAEEVGPTGVLPGFKRAQRAADSSASQSERARQ